MYSNVETGCGCGDIPLLGFNFLLTALSTCIKDLDKV